MANPRGTPENLLPGEVAPLKHQAYRYLENTDGQGLGLLPLCNRCVLRERCPEYDSAEGAICRPAAEAQRYLLRQILDLPQVDPVQDFALVCEYVKMAIMLQIIDRYVTETGMFQTTKKGPDLTPILHRRITYASHLARLSDRLGLNPAARQKLGASGKPLSPVIAAVLDEHREDRERRRKLNEQEAEELEE